MGDPVILLVEDNADDEELTISSLRDAGIRHEIAVARDGAEALDYLFRKGKHAEAKRPLLVLLDLKLPKVGGLEILKRMREPGPLRTTPVVIFTSSKEERDLIESYHLGANSYVQKPVDFDDFAVAVEQLGVFWLTRNQYPPAGTREAER